MTWAGSANIPKMLGAFVLEASIGSTDRQPLLCVATGRWSHVDEHGSLFFLVRAIFFLCAVLCCQSFLRMPSVAHRRASHTVLTAYDYENSNRAQYMDATLAGLTGTHPQG